MNKKSIYLRTLEKDDIPKTHGWINDSEISSIMGVLPNKSLLQQYEWFEKVTFDNTKMIFAICNIYDNEHIGNVALGDIDYINRHASFSIFIPNEDNKGKGFGTEATRLILEFAFNRLNLNKIYLKTSKRFEAARKMYETLGFKQDGVLREHNYYNGAYEDKFIYSILRSEFKV